MSQLLMSINCAMLSSAFWLIFFVTKIKQMLETSHDIKRIALFLIDFEITRTKKTQESSKFYGKTFKCSYIQTI